MFAEAIGVGLPITVLRNGAMVDVIAVPVELHRRLTPAADMRVTRSAVGDGARGDGERGRSSSAPRAAAGSAARPPPAPGPPAA